MNNYNVRGKNYKRMSHCNNCNKIINAHKIYYDCILCNKNLKSKFLLCEDCYNKINNTIVVINAIAKHRKWIMEETLSKSFNVVDEIPNNCYKQEVDLNGVKMLFGIRKVD